MITSQILVHSVMTGLSMGAIYVLMGLGLTLMFSIMHIVNFAHGAVYMLGAYAIFYVYAASGLNFGLALVFAMLTAGLLGIVVERAIYRPIGTDTWVVLVALLALSIMIESVGYLVFGPLDQHLPPLVEGTIPIFGAPISLGRMVVAMLGVPIVIALFIFIFKTKLGKAMRAIEQNKEAAALRGINVNRINSLAFALGFALASAGGGLMATIFTVSPSMGELPLFKTFMIAILGGMGSLTGSVIAGILIGLFEGVAGIYLGSEMAFLVSYLLVIAVLFVRPAGLLGKAN